MGEEGLKMLAEAGKETGLAVINRGDGYASGWNLDMATLMHSR